MPFLKRHDESKLTEEEVAILKEWLDEFGHLMPTNGALTDQIMEKLRFPPLLQSRERPSSRDVAYHTARYLAAEIAARYSRAELREQADAQRSDLQAAHAHRVRAEYWRDISDFLSR